MQETYPHQVHRTRRSSCQTPGSTWGRKKSAKKSVASQSRRRMSDSLLCLSLLGSLKTDNQRDGHIKLLGGHDDSPARAKQKDQLKSKGAPKGAANSLGNNVAAHAVRKGRRRVRDYAIVRTPRMTTYIPPKMLTKMLLTAFSDSRSSNAFLTASAVAPTKREMRQKKSAVVRYAQRRDNHAPPPTSRKLAGDPPLRLRTSMVAMASPAPLTRHPIEPSSLMKLRPYLAASTSEASS